ncbi:ABC transporter permease subunit [Gorillibacterium sp. CAU 1737]|uniref:ABC transporter permease n=1 Tax=Gorillibacterium sp. CAU 1737 TaxID=3140362 RepID=UPI00326140F5
MRGWSVLFRKEWRESLRNFKLIWIPLVFLLLGVAQPVTSKLLPDLVKQAGNLPEGAVMVIPVPQPMEVLAGTLSNYSTVGLLVLVLATMAAVAGERSRGVTGMLMAKPISAAAYLSSKWSATVLLSTGSLVIGYLGAWYYTEILIGPIDAGLALQGLALYALWFAFYLTVTLVLSALMRSAVAAAAITLLSAALLAVLGSSLPQWMKASPGILTARAQELLLGGLAQGTGGSVLLPVCITGIGLILLMVVGIAVFRRLPLTPQDS